ncbi:MAG: hypothetical protein LUD27_00665 [Clostridia bacterium]|nr:hypothetical protein [Clostridia bacterium]
MADGYADGSIVVNTEVDAEGFEAGSKKLLIAIQGLTNQIKILGDTIKESFSGKAVTAVSDSNTELDKYKQQVEALEQQLAELGEKSEQANAKIDFSSAARSGSSLEKRINALNAGIEKLKPISEKAMAGSNSAMLTMAGGAQKLQAEIASLQSLMAQVGDTKVPTEEYAWLEKQIAAIENKLRQYSDKEEQLKAEGISKHSKKWQALQREIQLTEGKLITYQKELEQEKNDAALVKDTEAFKSLAASIQAAESQLASMTANARAMQPFNEQFGDIKERAAALQANIAKVNAEIEKLTAKQTKMRALGTDEQSAAWKSVAYDIDQAKLKLSDYQTMVEILKMELDGVTMPDLDPNTEAYQSASASVNALSSDLALLGSNADATTETTEGDADRSAASLSRLQSLAGGLVSALATVGKVAASTFVKVVKGVKNAISKFAGLFKSVNSNSNALTRLIKKFTSLGTMLKRMVLRKLISAIISAVKDGIDNLALYSDELNESLSALKSSLTQLKNSFASSLAPILSVATPIVTTLIDKLSSALDYVAQFIAALSGKTTYTKAIAVQEDYAESLDGTASSAENAKNALAGFDNLNNVTTSDDSETQFETAEIDSNILDLADKLKNYDLSGILTDIINTLNSGIATLNSILAWDNAGEKIASVVSSITSALNQLLNDIDWEGIGKLVSNGVQTVINTVGSLITTLDWSAIGSAIAKLINGVDTEGVVADLTVLVSDVIDGLLEGAIKLISDIDWESLGTELWNSFISLFTETDWNGIISGCSELAGEVVEAIAELIWGILKGIWQTIVSAFFSVGDYFIEEIEECGGNVGLGLLKGIGDVFVNIWEWLKENIFGPFINGIKSLFGINSPSTVMEEIGGYISEGLLNGISNAWSSITNFFSTAFSTIKNTINTAWNSIKSTTSTVWNTIKSSLSSTWSSIKSTASTTWNTVKSGVSTAWNSIKSTTSTTWNTVKSSISSAWSSITSTTSTKLSSLKSSISSTFSSVVSSAKTWGSDICSNIASGITGAVSTVTSAVSSVASKIKSWLGFSEPEEGPLSDFHTYMPDMLDLMAEGIYDNTPVAIAAVSELAEAVSDELQSGDNTLAIGTEAAATDGIDGVLSGFADKVTNSFANLVNKLQAIAESVTFAVPFAANAIPYSVTGEGGTAGLYGGGNSNGGKILEAMQVLQSKVDEVVRAIKDKETGITDADIYSSVKRSVRSEQKSTGRTPF